MKIAISLEENADFSSAASVIFGRCPFFMIVDAETMEFEILENPARQASGGAGIQAAQWVLDQGARTVISGNLGPKAFDVLSAGQATAYRHNGGSAKTVLAAFQQGKLECLLSPSTVAHSGTA